MACFGQVVDDAMLDKMDRYKGKPKTQEDRAREAVRLIQDNNKKGDATAYVRKLKESSGDGVSTLCLFYNATGETLTLATSKDWYGQCYPSAPYPQTIGNGQWCAFLHVKSASEASGSNGAVVYRGWNGAANKKDFLIGWSTPWGIWYKNKSYCQVGEVGSFPAQWPAVYTRISNAGYTWTAPGDACSMDTEIQTGTSPLYEGKVQIPFSP